jgi:hypothetical protein
MKTNHRASLDAAVAFSLFFGRHWRPASEPGRYVQEQRLPNNRIQNVWMQPFKSF